MHIKDNSAVYKLNTTLFLHKYFPDLFRYRLKLIICNIRAAGNTQAVLINKV